MDFAKNEKRWSSPLFTKQTTKITLRTLLFKKNQSTQISSKKLNLQSQV
jgi:hypothetical protein